MNYHIEHNYKLANKINEIKIRKRDKKNNYSETSELGYKSDSSVDSHIEQQKV